MAKNAFPPLLGGTETSSNYFELYLYVEEEGLLYSVYDV